MWPVYLTYSTLSEHTLWPPEAPTATADTKRKEDKSMIKTTMKIDGMMCGMCEAHVCDAIRKAVPSAKKITASRSNG